MVKQVAKSSVQLIIIIMILECFMVCFATPSSGDLRHKSFRVKAFPSLLLSVLAQGEEEKSETEGEKSFAVELADFSNVISCLSKIHTPDTHFIVFEHPDSHQRSLFKLFRAFVI